MTDESGKEMLVPSRDSELIKHAGLTPAKVADIIGISRAAIYQRLKNGKSFSAGELLFIVRSASASDSPHFDSVCAFIEEHYPPDVSDLVLPDRVSLGQFESAAKKGERLIFGFNGNADHLSGKSLFTRAFSTAHKLFPEKISVVTQETWLKGYLTDHVGLEETYPYIVSSEFKHPLSFVLIEKAGQPARAFYFGRHSLAETDKSNAQELSKHVASLTRSTS